VADAQWEHDWKDRPGADHERDPLTKEELTVARKLMGHMRFMVSNQEFGATIPDDGRPIPELELDATGNYPKDERVISPSHSEMYLVIEHMGTYWEVRFGSREFSSNFATTGRGRTLAEALADAEKRG